MSDIHTTLSRPVSAQTHDGVRVISKKAARLNTNGDKTTIQKAIADSTFMSGTPSLTYEVPILKRFSTGWYNSSRYLMSVSDNSIAVASTS